MSVRASLAVVAVAALAGAAPAVASANVDPADIEDEVVCIQCQRPLSTSAGSAADDQRAFIQRLANEGLTKQQIKDRLVAEYGERVLVDDGSPIAAAAPWIAGLGGLAAVSAVLLRRARRDGDGDDEQVEEAAPAAGAAPAATPSTSAEDEARIDAELAALELED